MSVHHLCIASGGDLVVLLPRSLALLLRELRRQQNDMLLSVETLLPSAFAGYLLRVINSNRQTRPCFRFSWLAADPLDLSALHTILCRQLAGLQIDGAPCFNAVQLCGDALLLRASDALTDAARDATAVFDYDSADGRCVRLALTD